MKAIIDVGLKARIYVTIIKFTIENQKDGVFRKSLSILSIEDQEKNILTIIHERSNGLCLRPLCPSIEFFGEFVPSALICSSDLCEIVIENCLMEMYDELRCFSASLGLHDLNKNVRPSRHRESVRTRPAAACAVA